MDSPRGMLHTLIGQREKAKKRWDYGNPNAKEDYLKYKKEVENLLAEHPELESAVETVEDYFLKKLYG
jgi:chromosome segregation ATPase